MMGVSIGAFVEDGGIDSEGEGETTSGGGEALRDMIQRELDVRGNPQRREEKEGSQE